METVTRTILITGATRGLGFEAARAATRQGIRVLAAGRDPGRTDAAATAAGAVPVTLDLASLAATRAAAQGLPRLDAVACNAGRQDVSGATVTEDGLEATYQVNVAAHVALLDRLLALGRLREPGRIVIVGSGTHDPARRTGMPAPRLDAPADVARPADASSPQSGRTAYTTSKLHCVLIAGALARELRAAGRDVHVCTFDPGLMPGTGLAREYPGWQRALWASAMRGLRVLPGVETPRRSGAALAELLCAPAPPVPSGACVTARLRAELPSTAAQDEARQDAALAGARALVRAAEAPVRTRVA